MVPFRDLQETAALTNEKEAKTLNVPNLYRGMFGWRFKKKRCLEVV
jgi:hypothetical protein